MLSVSLIMRAIPGCADRLAELWKAIAAEVTATEPGCLQFQISRDVEDPDQFVIFEVYADQEALDAHHANSKFAAEMGAKLAGLRQTPVQRIVGELVSG